ncbi:hypothetical protein SAMN05444679_12394 [Variovorax sp. CF079]|nr:hypothetical protein SAMN05444679_12394 [Variovorax sp. CF079]
MRLLSRRQSGLVIHGYLHAQSHIVELLSWYQLGNAAARSSLDEFEEPPRHPLTVSTGAVDANAS